MNQIKAQTMAKQALLTQTRLQQLLDYNPETGIFTWKVARGRRVKIGATAGCVDKVTGYVVIGVDGKLYKAHRLAWLHYYGIWPTGEIDHVDGDKLDNRIAYLKDGTKRDNLRNSYKHRAGYLLGANLDKRDGKYQAYVRINGKREYLGRYDTAIEAHVVAWIAKHP